LAYFEKVWLPRYPQLKNEREKYFLIEFYLLTIQFFVVNGADTVKLFTLVITTEVGDLVTDGHRVNPGLIFVGKAELAQVSLFGWHFYNIGLSLLCWNYNYDRKKFYSSGTVFTTLHFHRN
jgi:hypothetical protein